MNRALYKPGGNKYVLWFKKLLTVPKSKKLLTVPNQAKPQNVCRHRNSNTEWKPLVGKRRKTLPPLWESRPRVDSS